MKAKLMGALAGAVALLGMGPAALSPGGDGASQADCSFSHPSLPGWCNMTIPVPRHATPRTACESVLRCLNSSACPDREKYCSNTGLVRDWKLEEAQAARPRVDCAYSNPIFSGWCRLTAPVPKGMSPQQACAAVLACLNGNPCAGFSNRCDPEIWSGWRLEEVRRPEPEPTPRH